MLGSKFFTEGIFFNATHIIESFISFGYIYLKQLKLNKRKITTILTLLVLSLSANASDFYIITTDLNLRAGAGKNYESILVLEKRDTVQLLESVGNGWVRIRFKDKTGYSAKQYLQKVEIAKKPEITTDEGKNNRLFVFWFFISMIIVIAVILKEKGQKHRNKSTAALLALFFGAFGFQKFYLGQSIKGTYSIIFCFTFIPTIIGFIDFIKLGAMKEAAFNAIYNFNNPAAKQKKQNVDLQTERRTKPTESFEKATNSNSTKKAIDSSIIDVSSENLDLSIRGNCVNSNIEPPHWNHTYIYSHDEIKYASQTQKKYYAYFKRKVLNGEFVDIQGNTNYAFVLYFELLEEYQSHRDIELLDRQLKLLGEICPKIKNYSLQSFQDELRKRNDEYSVNKLKDLEDPIYQFENGYSYYNPDLYKLGNKYQGQLGLSKQEVRWLNKFYNPDNVFTSIEGCCIATIKYYLIVLKELEKRLKKNKSTLAKEASYFKEKVEEKHTGRSSGWEYYDISYLGQQAESDVYLTMFKRVENFVRASFGHKRKVSGDFPYSDESLTEEFEDRLGKIVAELIDELKNSLNQPDVETEIALNTQNVNRWKAGFDALKSSYIKEDKQKFIDGLTTLEEANQKNPNIENIFFEASKFMAKHDKVLALECYAKYIYYDLKSTSFDNKQLAKTIHKSLFKTGQQVSEFKEIISELIQTADIHTALGKISKIYALKRKRIELDHAEIQQVEQKHEGTVELLNEYLEDEAGPINVETCSEEDTEIAIVTTESDSIFISAISMGQVQEELIKKIVKNSYEIHQDEVDKYATENGMFKNQLIDSINEACEECLEGEALIEEDGENYIIEASYYNEIVK